MSKPVAKPYLTIRADGSHETEVKRSRFICHLARVGDEEAAQEFIARIRKQYWDARHNCTAFVVGAEQRRERSNDDGEPGARRACRCWRCCVGAASPTRSPW